jgi:hypothetical protein
MKKLILLSLLMFSMALVVHSQTVEPYQRLVISEVRMSNTMDSYVELTNMGSETLDLSQYRFGTRTHFHTWEQTFANESFSGFLTGTLEPGESFVIRTVTENLDSYYYRPRPRLDAVTDFKVYIADPVDNDSVSTYHDMLRAGDYDAFFLYYYAPEGDSVLVDQFAMEEDTDGTLTDKKRDVSGYPEASRHAMNVRKFSVKQGNPDWTSANGSSIEESEWLPVHGKPTFGMAWWNPSDVFPSVGNHGNYVLDENAFSANAEYPDVEFDFVNKELTLPWGIVRDSMRFVPEKYMNVGKGVAWQYDWTRGSEDSTSYIARNGDKFVVYAFGETLDSATLIVNVAAPVTSMNQVFPKYEYDPVEQSLFKHYDVTEDQPIIDSITGVPFSTRLDTLLKYLEIAPNASAEIEFVDGEERADIMQGDKLIVTAEDGSKKEYYISVEDFEPSANARLSALTWPEIPTYLRDVMGWVQDTIPRFNETQTNYVVMLPPNTSKVPALVPTTDDVNAKVDSDPAISLSGGLEDRTTTFTVTAEDGTTIMTYSVEFRLEQDPSTIQPFSPEPIISQLSMRTYQATDFIEIANIGNQPLDLSNYLLVHAREKNPAEAIQQHSGSDETSFNNRYSKYAPGYHWPEELDIWEIRTARLLTDFSTDPVVAPGDVFVVTGRPVENSGPWFTRGFPLWEEEDIVLTTALNPWGAEISGGDNFFMAFDLPRYTVFLFKITSDSVLNGTKGVFDPADFVLIDNLGSWDGETWSFAGIEPDVHANKPRWYNITRKPTIIEGNTENATSMGTTPEDSEWIVRKKGMEPDDVSGNLGISMWVSEGIGSHYVEPVNFYKSTISSNNYIVSSGFSNTESVYGVDVNTTIESFFNNIIKADPAQVLEVHSTDDGSVKGTSATVANNDTLVVTSSNGENITRYIITVVEGGLDSNAVLTSTVYDIVTDEVNGTGFITGMEYGVPINEVMDNVEKPASATLYVLDQNNSLVPMKIMNNDTMYVNTIVHDSIYFKVVAQDGSTIIVYDLEPTSESSDAFVLSDLYEVDQDLMFIDLINTGTSVSKFLLNINPVKGATVKVVDKTGRERTLGNIAFDDKLLVTSEDETNTALYNLGSIGETEGTEAFITSNVFRVTQLDSLTINDVPQDMMYGPFVGSLNVAEGATMIIVDSEGNEKTSGSIELGDEVVVTSGNGIVTNTYKINVGIAKPAYVESDVYTVNASLQLISGVPKGTTFADFMANITPAPGATIVVLDLQGNEVSTGEITEEHRVRVTSEDEATTIIYSLDILSSIDKYSLENVMVYPNPTSEILYVEGLPLDVRITVRDLSGREVIIINSEHPKLELPVNSFNNGFYILSVKDDEGKMIHFRFLKQE